MRVKTIILSMGLVFLLSCEGEEPPIIITKSEKNFSARSEAPLGSRQIVFDKKERFLITDSGFDGLEYSHGRYHISKDTFHLKYSNSNNEMRKLPEWLKISTDSTMLENSEYASFYIEK